ncbi:helix-turn-helix domain-containing protein [Hutsoniella sourekii]|uniref:helix-turn-helix domain-containing protein n=1 Tax=Hutsoniella sourekii TaxID=87650 RepID=UPI000486DEFF|nr:helix-turn-helix domain-containing protein [Hutsoniella sourekii]
MIDSLLTKKEQRQLDILSYFLDKQAAEFVKLSELADIMGCSTRIISSDLNDIEERFPRLIAFHRTQIGVDVELLANVSYIHFFREYSSQSLNFQVLERVLHERDLSVDQLANDYFTSRSTVYRSISEINEYLAYAEMDLRISTNLELQGPEISVRHFYPLFIKSYVDLIHWPFDTVTYEDVIDLYQALAQTSDYLNVFVENPQMYIRLGVNIDRILKNHYVDRAHWDLSDKRLNLLSYDAEVKHDLEKIFNRIGLPFNQEIIFQSLVGLVEDSICLNCQDWLAFSRAKGQDAILEQFQSDLIHLQRKYRLSPLSQEAIDLMVTTMYNHCVKSSEVNNFFLGIRGNVKSNFFSQIQKINGYFLRDMQLSLIRFASDLTDNITNIRLDLMMYYLITLWPSLLYDLAYHKTQPRIAIYTNNRFLSNKYKEMLAPAIGDLANIQAMSGPFNWQQIQDSQADIILTTYILPAIPDKETFVIDDMPDEQVICWLQNRLNVLVDHPLA